MCERRISKLQAWMKPRWLSLISFLLLVGVSLGTFSLTYQSQTMEPEKLKEVWWIVDLVLFGLTIVTFITTSVTDPGFYPIAPGEEDLEESDTAPLNQTVSIRNVEVKMKW